MTASQAAAAPARPAAAAPYDRQEWETAIQSSRLHFTARLVALTLSHHAVGGRLPAGGVQHSARMSERTGLGQERIRQCLRDLEKTGYISRPPSVSWEVRDQPRPITLTLPAPSAARTDPPSTSERP